jgi:hypothetical protein
VDDTDQLIGELIRLGRRHDWSVVPIRLGYYTLRFTRSEGTIGVRIVGSRITDVTVDLGRDHYQLSLPARRALEELIIGQDVRT